MGWEHWLGLAWHPAVERWFAIPTWNLGRNTLPQPALNLTRSAGVSCLE